MEFIEAIYGAVEEWYMGHMNYFTIALLMAIESSFIPFPSEIVIPPAAWKAAQGHLNVYLVVFWGTVGAVIGSLFNYYFAKYLGRALIYRFADTRFAHLCLIDRAGVEKSEKFFIKYGNISTLIGRLIPVIRQLISLPAGLAGMRLFPFVLFTMIGAGVWNAVLAALGYYFYSQKEKLELYYREIAIGAIILGILFFCYLIYNGFFKKRPVQTEQ